MNPWEIDLGLMVCCYSCGSQIVLDPEEVPAVLRLLDAGHHPWCERCALVAEARHPSMNRAARRQLERSRRARGNG